MRHRLAAILPAYLLVQFLAFGLAHVIRFEFAPSAARMQLFWMTLPFVLIIKLTCGWAWGEFRRSYRYVTVSDLITLAGTVSTSLALVWLGNSLARGGSLIPRSVICIDAGLSILLTAALRLGYRTLLEVVQPLWLKRGSQKTLIYGTGPKSIAVLRMLSNLGPGHHPYRLKGFVCSTPGSTSLIAGQKVYSLQSGQDWAEIKRDSRAVTLLIPGDTPGRTVRELLRDCRDHNINVYVIPTVDDMIDGRFKLSVRDLTVSDLLRREPNQLDMESIREYVTGRRVMVTGGAGSIGSELCRQLVELNPEMLIVYDQSEFGVFSVEQEFAGHDLGGVDIRYIVADVLDERMLHHVLNEFSPQLVFHAAAYKHVPLMEDNPQSAVMNNILGTKTVADAASQAGVERFVLISTDKAVRPTSVMGASKLVAEKYVQALARVSETRFLTVRFGNVLNSAGSVIPTFRSQIQAGGPITVTHPEMRRFFMTIPEAVQLVLQAGAIGESGSVLILDMGEPVKIVDLAKDLIMLSGLRYPDDIDIQFTGMRPGEKLYEELFYGTETDARRIHEKIFCGDADSPPGWQEIIADIRLLESAALTGRLETLKTFQQVVAKHTDTSWVPSRLPKVA